MKKLSIFLTALIAVAALVLPLPRQANAVTDDYFVEGGRVVYDFSSPSQGDDWAFFTEFDKLPWIQGGKIFAWTLAEQKMILKDRIFTDVDVRVDISTLNKNGKFGSGIYVCANGVNSAMDGLISGWAVCLEHGASQLKYDVKLHRFENNSWKGAEAEAKGINYTGDTINLRVVVKSGNLHAFINGATTPVLSHHIGSSSGKVGIRCFYSPNTFDNFTVIAPGISTDKTELNALTQKAEELKNQPLAKESLEQITAALGLSQRATTQTEVDEAVKALKNATDNAVIKASIEQLTALISEVELLDNEGGMVYTVNSWNSLMAVKNICLSLDENSSEWDISYWYSRLNVRKNGLIPYLTEVTE